MSGLETTLVPSPPPMLMAPTLPALPVGLSKTCVIACFHPDRKGHYATKCPEPMKDRNASEN